MCCTLLAIGIMNVVAQIECFLHDGMLNLLADASLIQLIAMHGQWTGVCDVHHSNDLKMHRLHDVFLF